jgi:hypothetical protein
MTPCVFARIRFVIARMTDPDIALHYCLTSFALNCDGAYRVAVPVLTQAATESGRHGPTTLSVALWLYLFSERSAPAAGGREFGYGSPK